MNDSKPARMRGAAALLCVFAIGTAGQAGEPPTPDPDSANATARVGPTPRAGLLPAADSVRFVMADRHEAARFLAAVFRTSLVLLDSADAPLSLELRASNGFEALGVFAQAVGLVVVRRQDFAWVASTEVLRHAAASRVSGLAGGRAIDLDFSRADAAAVLRLLAEVERLELEGEVSGAVTVVSRSRPARDVVAALLRLGGASATLRGRTLRLGAPARFEGAIRPGDPSDSCRPRPDLPMTILRCVPVEELSLRAVARRGDRPPVGLLAGRGLHGPVRRGDRVAAPLADGTVWRVESVEASAVVLTRPNPGGAEGELVLQEVHFPGASETAGVQR